MRIAVIGGTGLTGRHTVVALEQAGHEPVIVARSHGVDVLSGSGLDRALDGVDAIIDVTNLRGADVEETQRVFGAATRNLLEAGARAAVRHYVLLSIVAIDRLRGNAHYAGKRVQEEVLAAGEIPFTIQRATQYHEFADMMLSWTRRGESATVPPLLLQPVAVADVGEVLAELASGAPQERARDLAGPEPQDLVDMIRRICTARGEAIHLVPSWRSGVFGVDAAGEALLPGPDARLAPTTFDTWLARLASTTVAGTP